MAKKKVTHNFKTKRKEGKLFMICRNSIEDQAHWSWQFFKDKPRCNEWVEVGPTTTATLCHHCVNKTVGPPEMKGGYISKGRIRGWQFMKEFVDPGGNVFHKGKEQPALKGTLNPTEPKPTKKKLSKSEKIELKTSIAQQIIMLKGRVKKATLKKDIKSTTVQLKKLERQLKKIR